MPTPMDMGYVMVADRHAAFVKDYPGNRIETSIEYASDKYVIVKCRIWKTAPSVTLTSEPSWFSDATGLAGMPIPGPNAFTKNSEVENAETSALGRALAMLGYHPKESFASDDEIRMKHDESLGVDTVEFRTDERKATPAQLAKLTVWAKKIWSDSDDPLTELRKFTTKTLGVTKKADLTRDHITYLFGAFSALEAEK